jgi:squalene-hopene/tetraprenyl-beta-curcumene cyclase
MIAGKICPRLVLAVILTLTAQSLLDAQSLKDVIDQEIRGLREAQNDDGSYGPTAGQPDVTASVLLALASSPRRYTDADGPFIRKAADWLVAKQLEDGSLRAASHGDRIRSTALAATALEQVNPTRHADFLDRAEGFLIDRLSGAIKPQTPETGFALARALSGSTRKNLHFLVKAVEASSPDPLFGNTCLLLAGKSIPDGFGSGWTTKLEEELRKKGTNGEGMPTIRLLASCTLFSLLEKEGNAPGLWADRLSKIIVAILGDPRQPPPQNPPGVEDRAILITGLSLCLKSANREDTPPPPAAELPPLPAVVDAPLPQSQGVSKALDFLNENQKEGKFGFMGFDDPGITGMALSAVMRASRLLGREPPAYIAPGLEYLDSLRKKDGSVYLTGLKTYVTSVALMAFEDSKDPRFKEAVAAARDFLIAVQSDEGEGYSMEEDSFYGGMGYGGDERPDLSNTQMAIDALRAAGVDKKHESFQKAIRFLRKCQNLAEVNPTEVRLSDGKKVVAGTDGGGVYYPGDSKAGLDEVDQGVFVARSYGSMTYALLKSYLFAGLDPEDRRVRAAAAWIEKNYTLEENPGFRTVAGRDLGQQGLFYYYLTMARALDALGREEITDSRGATHNWRIEMRNKILSIQRVDGSWINEGSPRWFEGNPVLATSYALLVLDVCGR